MSTVCLSLAQNSNSKEDFAPFFKKFNGDSSYHVEHIQFPLSYYSFGDDYETWDTAFIRKDDWTMYNLLEDIESKPYRLIYNKLNGKAYNVIQQGKGNGIRIEYRFKRYRGSWYLIEIEDSST